MPIGFWWWQDSRSAATAPSISTLTIWSYTAVITRARRIATRCDLGDIDSHAASLEVKHKTGGRRTVKSRIPTEDL